MTGQDSTLPPPPRVQREVDFGRPDWREGPRASTRALQAVIVGAAAAAGLWGYGVGSVGVGLWLCVAAIAVAAVAPGRDRARIVALVTAAAFAGFLAVRSTPWLVPLNLLASFGLIAFAAILPADRRILQRPARVIVRFFGLARIGRALLFVARPIASAFAGQDRSRLNSVIVGLTIAAPLVIVIGSLLAAGDAVFEATVGQVGYAGNLVRFAWFAGWGALFVTTLLFAATRSWDDAAQPRRYLGSVEATIVVAALAGLYGLFAVAQAVATFGGVDEVLETAGLTRAEYARAGFFQLLWASGLTLGALLALDRVRDRGHDTLFRVFAVLSSLLTLLVVAVSVSRLLAYVDDFGWTMLRLYTVLFAAWIGLLFLGLAARFAGIRTMQDWYPVFVAVTGLIWLMGVNVMNPEAFVAERNIESAEHRDLRYLSLLSPDATPTIVDRLDLLDDAQATVLLDQLCELDDEPLLGSVGTQLALAALDGRC